MNDMPVLESVEGFREIQNEDVLRSRQLAGRVVRYHTWPMIRKPNVAEHSARVATLYVELWGMPRAEVLYYCLMHDYGELAAGDTPHGAKRDVPELGEAVNEAEKMGLLNLGITLPILTRGEWLRFKISDLLEMWETSIVELNMGNQYAMPVIHNILRALEKLYDSSDEYGEELKVRVERFMREELEHV